MDWYFVSPVSIDDWSWEDAEKGIGGNEQGVTEFSRLLVARGHNVLVYTRTPWKSGERTWEGVKWTHVSHARFDKPGIWVLFRCPEAAKWFPARRTDQQIWFVIQDFEHDWEAPYFSRIDRVLATCMTHQAILAGRFPDMIPKLGLTSNGVKVDLIQELEREGLPPRNPLKIMYASSPDRGLRNLIDILGRARKEVPDLELHAFYGFNGIDRIAAINNGWPEMEREKAKIQDLASRTPHVHLRGRVTQRQLYQEWLSSGIWIYPTTFQEMSCITGREAQCCGAIPIYSPVWGIGDNVMHGTAIEGNPEDPAVRQQFADQLVAYSDPKAQEVIRKDMMIEARQRCSWARFTSQWVEMAMEEAPACVP